MLTLIFALSQPSETACSLSRSSVQRLLRKRLVPFSQGLKALEEGPGCSPGSLFVLGWFIKEPRLRYVCVLYPKKVICGEWSARSDDVTFLQSTHATTSARASNN
jgi:hypothetical protein